MIRILRAGALALGAAAVLASPAAFAPAALAQAKPDVRIATGTAGGAYYAMGAVLADALQRSGRFGSATSEAASGGIESARLVVSKQVTLAAMDANWVKNGRLGKAPFDKQMDLVTVVPLGVWSIFFVTLDNSPIKSLDDLKGKRVAVGAKGSGMEAHARVILGSVGLKFDDIRPVFLAFGPGAQAVREGKADAQLQCCIPQPSFTELTELAKARMVGVSADHMKRIVSGEGVYADGVMPKGAFKGHDRDARVIEILNGYIGTSALPENTAYLIAKTFIENLDNMAAKSPQYRSVIRLVAEARQKGGKVLEMGAPLHPGSLRAFKEAGILK
jgi:TRAP transporter TAXI family solute receptor